MVGGFVRQGLDRFFVASAEAAFILPTLAGWVRETLAAERERWPLWLPVGVGIGTAIYFTLTHEPPLWLGLAGMALALALVIEGLRRRPALVLVGLAIGAVGLGFTGAKTRTLLVDAPVLAARTGPAMVSGQVIEVEPKPGGPRITLADVRVRRLGADETPGRVRIRLRDSQGRVAPGDWISIAAILMPPPAPSAPGAFDFPRHAFFKGLGAVGFAVGRVKHAEAPEGKDEGSFALWLSNLRQRIYARITQSLGGTIGAVAAALMTGIRGAIPEEVMEAMRASGLAHLLAISGLHIGLVTGVLFFAIRGLLAACEPIALRFAIKKWAAFGALLGAFAYLLVTGATVPTQRAFLMAALVLSAVMLDRTAISMRLVAWAALIVLLLAPESLLGASFQMSFAAVIALVAGYEAARVPFGRWRAKGGWWRLALIYLLGVGLTTLIAGSATAPFVVYHFNRFSAFGLAANLLAVPVTALWIMPWATVAYILMPLGLEAVALAPMGWGIEAVIAIAREVAGWPGSVTLVPAMPVAGIALVAAGGLWLCLWQRRWRLFGVLAIAAGLGTVPLGRPPDILISGDGRLMAARTADGGLMLSKGRGNRFDRENWLRLAGLKAARPWPEETSDGGRLRCGGLGCIYRANGHVVALVDSPAAINEDCWIADVVIARIPIRGECPSAGTVVDRFDLWRNGAYALWLEEGRVRAESVRDTRGDRPWSPARKPRRARKP
ncbi:MAG: ComEC/Rec2 family competence protein [Proteobacteria bacterium]|nr:ComEC/Rec2 family competence protein [Pseudomonadota bacterium]